MISNTQQVYIFVCYLIEINSQVVVKTEPAEPDVPGLPALPNMPDQPDEVTVVPVAVKPEPDQSPPAKKTALQELFADIFVVKVEPAKPIIDLSTDRDFWLHTGTRFASQQQSFGVVEMSFIKVPNFREIGKKVPGWASNFSLKRTCFLPCRRHCYQPKGIA